MSRTHTTRLSPDARIRAEPVQVNFLPNNGGWQNQVRNAQPEPSNNVGVATNSSDKGSAQGVANKEYVEHEFFTLQGDCPLIPTLETVKIKAGDTVNCLGLGKHLSGKYFVDEVTRCIDNSDGYSHSILVQKNGFGDSLKNRPNNDKNRLDTIAKVVGERRHMVVKGDTLQSLALWYYGSVGYVLRIANANLLDMNFKGQLTIGKELIIP